MPKLAALAGLSPRTYSGSVFRVVPAALREQVLSTEGNRYYPGRWHLTGETGVLYTSENLQVALLELGRHAARLDLQGALTFARIRIELRRVLDLTQSSVLAKLGLSKDALVRADTSMTQAVSLHARRAGFQGLLVPSATGSGVNLVVFENNLAEGCLIAVEEIGAA